MTSNGNKFSTPEIDNDVADIHCAGNEAAGWWFAHCSTSNLNKDSECIWMQGLVGVWDVQASRMLVKLYY